MYNKVYKLNFIKKILFVEYKSRSNTSISMNKLILH